MSPKSFQELPLFLLESFGKSGYMESFPQVFGNNASGKHFHIRKDGQLAAFCASIPFHWSVNGTRICGQCIGSVCSSEKYRGQGSAREVMTLAELDARKNGADFTFLFSDLDSFYRKLGYHPYGEEIFVALGVSPAINDAAQKNLQTLLKIQSSEASKLRYGYTKPGETLSESNLIALWNLIQRTSHHSENTLSFLDFSILVQIPEVEIHTLWRNETPVAVFFVGKGADFQSVAHSSAAENLHLLARLFSCYFSKFPGRSLLLMLPPKSEKLAKEFYTASSPAYYAKVLDTSAQNYDFIVSLITSGALYPRTFQSI